MNNYDDEATLYQNPDNEATQFEKTNSKQNSNETTDYTSINNDEAKVKTAKGRIWKRATVGAGSGLLIGGVATVLMGMEKADAEPEKETESNNHKEELSNPEWVDDQIQVATTVNDNMSFGEAFATARAEVGPGGCFEWHGNIYGTYTADEWNNMTVEQRTEWSDHFSWSHIDHSASNVVQHSTLQSSSSAQSSSVHGQATTTNDDDIEVVSVNHTDNHNDLSQTETGQQTTQAEVVEVSQGEPEIEILGVVHDNETGANIGGMTIDGQDVILIDVDNDLAFDYMATDANGNGQIDQNELIDIQGQNLTVNDLGGFSNSAGDLYTNNEGPDYSNDSIYEG